MKKMNFQQHSLTIPIVTILVVVFVYKLFTRKRRQIETNKQPPHGNVIKLIIYPIKSLAGIEVDQLEVHYSGVRHGPLYDRAFVLLNSANKIVTQRTKPKLSLIKMTFHPNLAQLWITGPRMDRTLKLSIERFVGYKHDEVHFSIRGQPTSGWDRWPEANQWFTEYLNGDAIRLIGIEQQAKLRPTSVQTSPTALEYSSKHNIFYQDGAPVLIINQESIRDLNTRLAPQDRVSYLNFRPTILIDNYPAYEEDELWYIGMDEYNSLRLEYAQRCARCSMINIIPDRGFKSPNHEPLRTLKTYRIVENLKHLYKKSPLFGVYMIVVDRGEIKLGDEIHYSLGISFHRAKP